MIGEVLALSKLDGEIDTVLNAIGSDSRIGNKYLNFGFGFGRPLFFHRGQSELALNQMWQLILDVTRMHMRCDLETGMTLYIDG